MCAAPADFDDSSDIFSDKGPPLGSDPFALNEARISVPTATSEHVNPIVAVARLGLRHDLTFTEILTHAAAAAASVAGAGRALFFECNLRDGSMAARVAVGFAMTESAVARLGAGEGFAAFAAQRGRAVWSEEARSAESYFQWLADCAGCHAAAAVTVPVMIRGQCFGAIEIYDVTHARDAALEHSLMALADAAAIAIETRLLLAQGAAENYEAAA
jgi:GAF domain-containing protein